MFFKYIFGMMRMDYVDRCVEHYRMYIVDYYLKIICRRV